MSTSPAMASNSSSAESSDSWQPSHEANFHTATVGRPIPSVTALTSPSSSQLADAQQPGDLGPAEHRPVAAQEPRAQLAVAAGPHAALHVALQRHVDALRGDTTLEQRLGREPHHDLWPAG